MTAQSCTSFTFRSLPGHIEGAGATITFSLFYQGDNLILQQHPTGPDSWAHVLIGGAVDALRMAIAGRY